MTTDTIAVIADKNIALVFRSIGAQIFENTNIKQTIKDLAARNFAIILISEKQFVENKELIELYKTQPYPIILPIPDGINNPSIGMDKIKENIAKAIGGKSLSRLGEK